jgi:hypothetical protein
MRNIPEISFGENVLATWPQGRGSVGGCQLIFLPEPGPPARLPRCW